MTGDLATEYFRRTNTSGLNETPPNGLQIESIAIVEQVLEDGRYRLEYSSKIRSGKKPPRMITLSVVVDPKKIQTRTSPKGSWISSSPDTKPVLSESDSKTQFVELSDLKGVKLQTWELKEEVGE